MKRHVLLVGLPGAGKSAAGRLAARQLSAEFVDIDLAIERGVGRSVRQIFTEDGEPAFRAIEAAAVETALGAAPQVVAPGGGWAAQPGHMVSLRGRALSV
ncbi:MAG TPA: shikimate kinase, partial [Gemmatimonadales bacterium]